MSIQIKLMLMIASVLMLTFVLLSYFSYQQSIENARSELYLQASKVRNVLMAYRHTGQQVFIQQQLPLTDKNLGLLPAYAIGQMSKVYSRWDKSGFSFNNVSDQPRNPEHQADPLELEIMDYFRNNDDEDTIFRPYTNESGEQYYIYAKPIWIKKPCLKCHDKPENAPKTIRERYNTAYNYQIGDLRGLLSIRMPAKNIKQRALKDFYNNIPLQIIALFIIFIFLALIIQKNVLSPLSLLSKAMVDVSKGNYSKRMDGLTGEFSNMQDNFNLMGQELEKNKNELESRVQQRTHELSNSNSDLNQTLSSLKKTQQQLVESEKMASLGGLVAGVAHEINTPIGIGVTASTHFSSLNKSLHEKLDSNTLKKSDLETYIKETEEAGEIILNNLTRAANLIKSFKQIAVDQTHENHRIINIRQYIDECLLSLKPALKKTDIQVEVICDKDIHINCNPGHFSQIITNLLMNSIKHAYEAQQKGLIKLEIQQQDNHALFHYSDDGKGISEQELSKIFDPFFTTARKSGGTGLGLSTVYNIIVQNMKGSIRCESQLGLGIHFYIDIECELPG